ncbi:hypothetical protein KSS87_021632 [Heliosperma pusillum]|nr:hypothetical protein KSS87_021632 [Heliosperma pusillum]
MADVVGKRYEIRSIVETMNRHKCRTIKLEDIQGIQLSCSLWGPHIVQVPTLISEQPNPDQSKIIVIQCVQTKKYGGHWRVQTTYTASVFHVNPNIPEVFEPSLSTPATSNSLQIIQIPDDDDDDDMSRDNIKIQDHHYKLCRTKCSKNDRVRWKCDRYLCDDKLSGFTSRVPRFQVKFVVTDASNEEANFMVFDTQIIQFITHTAAELPAKIEKVDIHGKYNVSQGSNLYTVSSMSDDEDLANKWIAKYTETFKEDYNFFKSSTKALMVRIQNAKVNKDGSIENIEGHNKLQAKGVHHEEEKSETAETSPKITPHKRSSPSIIAQRKELIEFSCETGDACSTTKKHVIEKKEK